MERLVEADGLPRTEGFFFGASGPQDKKDDRMFIAKAREALDDGYNLFYWANIISTLYQMFEEGSTRKEISEALGLVNLEEEEDQPM